MNAIATAGGFTYRANESWVFIKPSDGSKERKERLNDLLSVAPAIRSASLSGFSDRRRPP